MFYEAGAVVLGRDGEICYFAGVEQVWLVLRSSALGGIMRQRRPLALQTSREVFSLSDTLAAGKPLAGLVILGIR